MKMFLCWEHWSEGWCFCSIGNWISTMRDSVIWGLSDALWAGMAARGRDSGWPHRQGAELPSDQQVRERREGWGSHWELLWSKLLIGELHEEHHLSDLSTILMNVLFEIMTHIWTCTKPWKYSYELCFISSTAVCSIQHYHWYYLLRTLSQVLY